MEIICIEHGAPQNELSIAILTQQNEIEQNINKHEKKNKATDIIFNLGLFLLPEGFPSPLN